MDTLRRIVALILRPRAEWEAIGSEPNSIGFLVRHYIAPLSLITPAATVIGMTSFDRNWDPDHGYIVAPERILAAGATTLFGTIASILVLAAIFRLLAPMYGGVRDYSSALKVATYGAVPVLVAGATLVLPVMVIVSMIAVCHALFLFWLGAAQVLAIRESDRAEFVGLSLVLLVAASTLVGALAAGAGFF